MSLSLSPPCQVRVSREPLEPTTREPPSVVGIGSPWNSSAGGSLPPSYHVIFTAGSSGTDAPSRAEWSDLAGRAGNWNSRMLHSGGHSLSEGSVRTGEHSLIF